MFASNLSTIISIGGDGGSQTGYQVDTAWVYETSGEAVCLIFSSPVTQSSGNLTFYAYTVGAVTGTPTYKAEIRNAADGTDPDRPESGGSALATTADVSPTQDTWSTFSFTGVSLTAGDTYWIIIYNTHATPASNYCSWCYRGACDSHNYNRNLDAIFVSGYTTNGFTTDGSLISGMAPMVLKFNDGSIYGNPYVGSEAHAADTDDRGNRISFTTDLKIIGHQILANTTAVDGYEINQGASNIVTVTSDVYAETRSNLVLYTEQTLSGSTDYDFVATFGSASTSGTIYNMGEAAGSLPADVLACKVATYVTGSTPGSYTEDTSKIMAGSIVVSDLVAGSGSSGGMRLAGRGGLAA